MKYILFSLLLVIFTIFAVTPIDTLKSFGKSLVQAADNLVFKHLTNIGGVAHFVTLNKSYGGYASGQTVELPKSTEDTLIANGGAVTSAGPATSGALSTFQPGGAATIAVGASSVVITNPLIFKQSLVWAVVAQAAADATLLRVERVVPSDGFVTIYGTANATAAVAIDWAILNPFGNLSNPS